MGCYKLSYYDSTTTKENLFFSVAEPQDSAQFFSGEFYKKEARGLKTGIDYYAFGGLMPGRSKFPNTVKYQYQGQETLPLQDGSYSFELRSLNADLGRWNSIDPYSQFHSPYNAMGNNPISFTDPNGGYAMHAPGGYRMATRWQNTAARLRLENILFAQDQTRAREREQVFHWKERAAAVWREYQSFAYNRWNCTTCGNVAGLSPSELNAKQDEYLANPIIAGALINLSAAQGALNSFYAGQNASWSENRIIGNINAGRSFVNYLIKTEEINRSKNNEAAQEAAANSAALIAKMQSAAASNPSAPVSVLSPPPLRPVDRKDYFSGGSKWGGRVAEYFVSGKATLTINFDKQPNRLWIVDGVSGEQILTIEGATMGPNALSGSDANGFLTFSMGSPTSIYDDSDVMRNVVIFVQRTTGENPDAASYQMHDSDPRSGLIEMRNYNATSTTSYFGIYGPPPH